MRPEILNIHQQSALPVPAEHVWGLGFKSSPRLKNNKILPLVARVQIPVCPTETHSTCMGDAVEPFHRIEIP
jgi:hypothetical protein